MFLNGQVIQSAVIPYSSLDYSYLVAGNSTATNFFGAANPLSGITNFMIGIIDDIKIFNYALVDSEIESLYHEGGWGYTNWQAEIKVTDAGSLDALKTLTFGQDTTATDSIDTEIGEENYLRRLPRVFLMQGLSFQH